MEHSAPSAAYLNRTLHDASRHGIQLDQACAKSVLRRLLELDWRPHDKGSLNRSIECESYRCALGVRERSTGTARRCSPPSSRQPVDSRLRVTTFNLEGDEQSDLSVHGGVEKAVYVYPSEHYEFWRRELPTMELPWGIFGENFTTEGLFEPEVRIGDRFRVGSSEFVVTQPRLPCFKLGIRFGRPDILKRFLQSGRTGFYFAVAAKEKSGRVTPSNRSRKRKIP